MSFATRHLLDQFLVARRADRVARKVLRAVRSDPTLRAWGVQFKTGEERLGVDDLDGLRCLWTARGGSIDVTHTPSRAFGKDWHHGADLIGFHIEEITDRMRARGTWKRLEAMAAERMIQAIKNRVYRLMAAADPKFEIEDEFDVVRPKPVIARDPVDGATLTKPRSDGEIRERCRIAVWPSGAEVRAWIERDIPYFHVQMSLPVAALTAREDISVVATPGPPPGEAP